MRIGVMTFWQSQDNYGQQLQCYALQNYLQGLGHDAYVIRFYKPAFRFTLKQKLMKYGLHPWLVVDGIRHIFEIRKRAEENRTEPRHFEEFREQYIRFSPKTYTTFAQLKDDPPDADLYIVGSDQVWNPDYYRHNIDDFRIYLLDFVPAGKPRTSYAASFGQGTLSRADANQMVPFLKSFSHITCREESGIQICKGCGVEADWVCDPTLLIETNEWAKLAVPPSPRRSYVFAYVLSNGCAFSYLRLKEWADRRNLDVVYVTGNTGAGTSYEDDGAAKTFATVQQWLGFIRNAKYVVTNSFHCSLFSIVFGVPFGVFPLNGKECRTNSRIDSLCRALQVGECVIGDNEYDRLASFPAPQMDAKFIETSKGVLNRMINE